MEAARSSSASSRCFTGSSEEDGVGELRRGPWAAEEDALLVDSVARHGEGRWNQQAKSSGLRRSGKSCRLRWMNYLKPDVRRGNITLQEQLLILHLHSRWGNRWSKIAQELPGRTDNEIKNYWRTRVQKHARSLNVDSNSDVFRHLIRHQWMPRLVQKIEESSSSVPPSGHPLPHAKRSVSENCDSPGFGSSESMNASRIPPFSAPVMNAGGGGCGGGDGYCEGKHSGQYAMETEAVDLEYTPVAVEAGGCATTAGSGLGENDLGDWLWDMEDLLMMQGEGGGPGGRFSLK